jgi:hypothetical protein
VRGGLGTSSDSLKREGEIHTRPRIN